MNFKSALSCFCLAGCIFFAASALAQDIQDNSPVDGQMVRLNAKKLWRFSYLPNLPMQNPVKIADNLSYPSISPDGSRIVMFKKGANLNNSLVEWTANSPALRDLVSGEDVSNYITWSDNETFAMRERSKPFLRTSAHLHYNISPKKVALRNRKPIAEANFVAYDENDVIILESKKTRTLQAISDNHADRYYAPIVSPDERFVVFNGLSSGVHLFDIESNAVVFIGSHGTHPAFSPDGRYLIYTDTRDDGNDYTAGDLILIDLNDRSYRVIANPNHEIRLNATISRNAADISYMLVDGSIWRASLPLR